MRIHQSAAFLLLAMWTTLPGFAGQADSDVKEAVASAEPAPSRSVTTNTAAPGGYALATNHWNEIWIAPRTDGHDGAGTILDPRNGSGAKRFDAIMGSIPPDRVIHLFPGHYETEGHAFGRGYRVKRGWKIRGAGMGLTVLRLVNASQAGDRYAVFGSGYDGQVNGCEISDLTIDCNLEGQPAPVCAGAIALNGSDIRIERVHAIGWGSRTRGMECFVIFESAHPLVGDSTNNLVAGCIVDQGSRISTDGTTTIALSGRAAGGVGYQRDSAIRHCYVNGAGYTNYCNGPAVAGCVDGLVEDNRVEQTRFGFYTDSGTNGTVIIRNNWYSDVDVGVYLNGRNSSFSLDRAVIEHNVFEIRYSERAQFRGVLLVSDLQRKDRWPFGELVVRDNYFRHTNNFTAPSNVKAIQFMGVTNAFVVGNVVNLPGADQISFHANHTLVCYENFRWNGAPLAARNFQTGDTFAPAEGPGTTTRAKNGAMAAVRFAPELFLNPQAGTHQKLALQGNVFLHSTNRLESVGEEFSVTVSAGNDGRGIRFDPHWTIFGDAVTNRVARLPAGKKAKLILQINGPAESDVEAIYLESR